MVKMSRLFLIFAGLLIVLTELSLASAAPVIRSVIINDTDNFYSSYAGNNIVHVMANVTGTNYGIVGGGAVYANFSAFGAVDCGSSIGQQINLTNETYGGSMFNGTCNVGSEAAANNFAGGPVIIIAVNSTPPVGPPITDNSSTIVLYNMTTPPSPPPNSCTQFGPLTTNFTSVPDFVHVNFVVNIQANFTCLSEGRVNAPTFRDVMMLNLTSVDLSTPEKAQKLQLLQSALSVTLIAPHRHGNARIDINSTAFAELDTNASIQFFLLPFTRLPNITADNPSKLNSSGFVSNGFDPALNIATVNLTITVAGFSGYNMSDNVIPLINILSPARGLNISASTTSIVFSALINGTETELSYVSITNISGGATYVYNNTEGSTTNSANCVNISADKETLNCTIPFTVSGLSEGANTINVNVWDYGGSYPGNANSSSVTFNVDRIGPAVTVYSPASHTNAASILFNISAIDATTASSSCWTTLDGGISNNTMTKSGNYYNYTNASIAAGNYLAAYYCNDSLNNINGSTTTNFTIDRTAPTLNSTSAAPSTTSASISYVASEAVNITINYGTSSSLGSTATKTSYSSSDSVSLSSLTADTTYYYNTTICDISGNCLTNGTFSFATEAEEETISAGGGGGTSEFWTNTYVQDDKEFSEKGSITKDLANKERVRIKINDELHYIGVVNLTGTTATINVSSSPQQAVFNVGDEKKFEVTGDNYYDLLVKLNSIASNMANITIKSIYEKVPVAVPAVGANVTTNVTTTGTPEEAKAGRTTQIIIIAVILAIIVAAVIYFVIRKRHLTRLGF